MIKEDRSRYAEGGREEEREEGKYGRDMAEGKENTANTLRGCKYRNNIQIFHCREGGADQNWNQGDVRPH